MTKTKNIEKLRDTMQSLFNGKVNTFEAVVLERDDAAMTVDVEPFEEAELFDVRLKAAIDNVTDGIVEFPKVGSTVLVGIIRNNVETCFILKCSEVDKIVINGGELGGLVNWPDVKAELEKNNAILEALINVLTGAPVAEPGNGSPSALQASLSGALEGKQVGDFEDKEDLKVTH